jgi:hypothetical protein
MCAGHTSFSASMRWARKCRRRGGEAGIGDHRPHPRDDV